MGFRTAVLDLDENSPAGMIAHAHIAADYVDAAGIALLVEECEAITTEFENVPASTLAALAIHRRVFPSAASVTVCQHRAREKAHFLQSGVPCAPYFVLEAPDDLQKVAPAHFPAILKSSTLGYDGKGQINVPDAGSLAPAWASLGSVPCVLEKRVDLVAEFSIVVARGHDGAMVHLPVQQNLHRDGILAITQVPAPDISEQVAGRARDHAKAIAASLDYVGVMCVEFFLLRDGTVLANEVAPRPHNSGHYSIDACDVSQFELQVRTLAGLPLVTPRLHSHAVMLNLLGDLWFVHGDTAVEPPWPTVLALPGVHLHLYGKSQPRRGRKMGHVTITAADSATAQSVAQTVAQIIGISPP